jgi:putative hemolysin
MRQPSHRSHLTHALTVDIGLAAALLAGCAAGPVIPTPTPTQAPAPAGLPNPASVYCEQQGGRLEIRSDASGNQTGYCHLADGSECEEWAYFRGDCPAATATVAASPTPSAPPTEETCYNTEDLAALPLDTVAAWDRLCYLPYSGPKTEIDQAAGATVIRNFLQDPQRLLVFREITTMANSPSGMLRVERFVDEQGNSYLVAPLAKKLLEMDPGNVAVSQAPKLSDDELQAKAEGLIRREFPDWDTMKERLTYTGGAKGENHFFRWEASENLKGSTGMPPLVQVGMTGAGEVFSYLNTLYALQ